MTCPTCSGASTAPNTPLNRRSGLVCSTCWNTGTVTDHKLTIEANPSHRITRRRETLRGDRPHSKGPPMKTPTMEDEQYEQACDAFLDAMGVAGSEGEPFDTALARLSEHHGIVVTIGLHVEAMHRHAEAVSDADSDSAVDAGTL